MENKLTKKQEIGHILILLLTAFLWGCSFVAQSIGSESVSAFGFLAARSWIALLVLIPTVVFLDKSRKKSGKPTAKPKTKKEWKALLLNGCACGFFLFTAGWAQQVGIAYTTTAKSGFITAMYIVLVPVIMIFIERKMHIKVWISVIMAVAGLYLLSFTNVEAINKGDLWTLLCALLYSGHILMIARSVRKVDAVWLSLVQFIFTAICATICSILFEHNTWDMFIAAAPAIIYSGILSNGVAFTLQIVGQKDLNPTIASLVMSLESVFSALAGWVVLKQSLTLREFMGCFIMFAAIIFSQIPLNFRGRKKEAL